MEKELITDIQSVALRRERFGVGGWHARRATTLRYAGGRA